MKNKKLIGLLACTLALSSCTPLVPKIIETTNEVVIVESSETVKEEEYSKEYMEKTLKLELLKTGTMKKGEFDLELKNTKYTARPNQSYALYKISGNKFINEYVNDMSVKDDKVKLYADKYIIAFSDSETYILVVFMNDITDEDLNGYRYDVLLKENDIIAKYAIPSDIAKDANIKTENNSHVLKYKDSEGKMKELIISSRDNGTIRIETK